ncbi:hypothetical protein NPIL_54421, partial [Nephila pilipes]
MDVIAFTHQLKNRIGYIVARFAIKTVSTGQAV